MWVNFLTASRRRANTNFSRTQIAMYEARGVVLNLYVISFFTMQNVCTRVRSTDAAQSTATAT